MKYLFKSILSIIVIVTFIFNMTVKVNALENVEWLLLKENNDGKQWIDIRSLKRETDNERTVLTKYYSNPKKTKNNGETNLYLMRINCEKNIYKDISVNGIPSINSNWMSSDNDELIDIVIEKSCMENLK